MKKTAAVFILTTTLCLYHAHATNYYFSSTDGDDSRTTEEAQNAATPWKTLDKLNSISPMLQPGDFIYLKRGDVFYGSISLSRSGSAGSPISFSAYGNGAKPIITGFTKISSWSTAGNGLYEATISGASSPVNMVTVDGAFEAMGKYPKGNAGYLTVSSGSGTSSLSSQALSGIPDFTGGEVVWRPYHWVLWRGTVTSQSSGSVNFAPFPSTSGGPVYPAKKGYGFFFQNHPHACTQQGEWAYNNSTGKLTMYFDGNGPGSHGINVSTIDNLISLQGNSYITFDNIAVTGANAEAFLLSGSNNITINACDILFSGRDAVFANKSCSNITVSNSNINYANYNGIVAAGSPNWSISGNTITNVAAVAGMGGSGEGQYFGIIDAGNNSVVKNNNVINSGYVPINFKGSNVTIQNNFVDSFCTVKDDAGGIYFGGFSFNGSKVASNIVINGMGVNQGTPDPDRRAYGIYADDGTSNVEISNNSAAYNGNAGIYVHNGHELNIHDNTFFDNKVTAIKYYNDNNTIGNITLTGNIFFALTASESLLRSSGGSASPRSFFAKADNNYWCRPANESGDFQVPSGNVSLSGWKSLTGKESSSKTTPVPNPDIRKIRFVYNPDAADKEVSLGATYVDVRANSYPGSISLSPYSSAVLIYKSGSIVNGSPVANAGPDQNFFFTARFNRP